MKSAYSKCLQNESYAHIVEIRNIFLPDTAVINKHCSPYNEHFALKSYSIQATYTVHHTVKCELSKIKSVRSYDAYCFLIIKYQHEAMRSEVFSTTHVEEIIYFKYNY
jgi:hypothetical protein